jgi:hypothetical protein
MKNSNGKHKAYVKWPSIVHNIVRPLKRWIHCIQRLWLNDLGRCQSALHWVTWPFKPEPSRWNFPSISWHEIKVLPVFGRQLGLPLLIVVGGHRTALRLVSHQLRLNYSCWSYSYMHRTAWEMTELITWNYFRFTVRHVTLPVHILKFLSIYSPSMMIKTIKLFPYKSLQQIVW